MNDGSPAPARVSTPDEVSLSNAPPRRAWYRSIGGKLLLAFVLIAALTVGASLLSLIRFNQIDAVLNRLIEFSFPAVKISLEVQTKASDVIDAAGQVGGARDEVDRFNRMEAVTERIDRLWQAVGRLGATIGDFTRAPIQEVIARIDAQIGALNRATGDKFAAELGPRRVRQQISAAAAAADRQLAVLLDRMPASADGAAQDRGPLLRQIYGLRSDLKDIALVLERVRSADRSDELGPLRAELELLLGRFASALAAMEKGSELDRTTLSELATSQRTLTTLILRDDGILTLQERVLRARDTVAGLEQSLQGAGQELRQLVEAAIANAEGQALANQEQSTTAISQSRLWLILIAGASLVIAGLIVWLFVHRYVIARLNALAGSMLAIARGNLAVPVPAAGPDELGEMSRALVVFRDNAREIHVAREQAVQAQNAAEAASRAKSTFLANMSHELRTPLNAIIGYSEILAEDAADRGDPSSIEDLQKIQSAGRHLLGLINSILDLSKIEAGRMDVYLEQVQLGQLVEEVKIMIQPMIEKFGNRLVVDCPSDIGSMRTDLTKLKQGLINLLSNAAKFTKDGEVTLAIARKRDETGASRVAFRVSDSGIGMTQEQISRLFEAFSQADSSTTRNFGGTGLGLAITKRFSNMLGGTISVTSEPGAGSTFTMEIPDQADHDAAAAANDPKWATDEGDSSALTVLVVDDDPTVHEVLSATLVRSGYRVRHARDGAEALEIMRATPPDVVTLDVMMPKVDGWSVLGTMKSDPTLQQIPVIMLTVVDDRNLGYSLGAAEYMTKPVDRERLLALVRRFAAKNAQGVVLIVDDDAEVRNVVRATLQTAGLKTAEAENGRAALDWMDGNALPNLILLDLMMPEMDGFQFLDRMRDDKARRDVPVVVLTAKDLTADERAFLAERTILVLGKSAQPISSLGAALVAIATRRPGGKPGAAAPIATN
jgi:signal transduction histidine kinase/DNA-binding response OmpR family regulator